MGIEAQTALTEAKATYGALIAECEAEEKNLDAINTKRQHEYEMKKDQAYNELASG